MTQKVRYLLSNFLSQCNIGIIFMLLIYRNNARVDKSKRKILIKVENKIYFFAVRLAIKKKVYVNFPFLPCIFSIYGLLAIFLMGLYFFYSPIIVAKSSTDKIRSQCTPANPFINFF